MSLDDFISVTGNIEKRVKSATGLDLPEFQKKISLKATKNIFQISIHNECQQACKHCFQLESTKCKFLLEEIRWFYSYIGNQFKIIPFPREPLLIPDIIDTYNVVSCGEISTSAISSNLDNLILRSLKMNKINKIYISMHGNMEQHCNLTGISKRDYIKMIDSIKRFVDNHFSVEIVTTLYKGNQNCLCELSEILADIGITKWWIQRIIPTGRASKWNFGQFLYKENCIPILEEIARLRKKYKPDKLNIRLDLSWGPNFYSKNFLEYLCGQRDRWPNTKYACPVVSQQLHVVSYETKRIYPCLFFETFPEAVLGKISNGINNDINNCKNIYSEEMIRKNIHGICSKCTYFEFCFGGCRATAFAFAKKLGINDPLYASQDFCISNILDKNNDD